MTRMDVGGPSQGEDVISDLADGFRSLGKNVRGLGKKIGEKLVDFMNDSSKSRGSEETTTATYEEHTHTTATRVKDIPTITTAEYTSTADTRVERMRSTVTRVEHTHSTTTRVKHTHATATRVKVTSPIVQHQTESFSEMVAELQTIKTAKDFRERVVPIVPDEVANELAESEQILLIAQAYADTKTYEDIIKECMSMSKEINLPTEISKVLDGLTVLSKLEKWFNQTSNIEESEVTSDIEDSEVFLLRQIKPIMLAALWSAMLMALVIKKIGSIDEFQKKDIAKFVIALVGSIVSGIASFAHSGGRVCGFKSPTKYAQKYASYLSQLREVKPYLYSKIPKELVFENKNFEKMNKYEQASVQQGLNMAYTFRIGDNLLTIMQSKNNFGTNVLNKLVNSIWPLPTENEADRMYRLYCANEKLYYDY